MDYFESMRALARQALLYAYAPYSHFPVACVVRTEENQLFCGVNMENAAYPEGICAETAALSAMVTAGKRRVVEAVVCSQAASLCFPCGGCRQRLAEFSTADTIVHIIHISDSLSQTMRMSDLLPYGFSKDTLGV